MDSGQNYRISTHHWIRTILVTSGAAGLLLFVLHPHLILGDTSEFSRHIHQSHHIHAVLETIIGITSHPDSRLRELADNVHERLHPFSQEAA